MLGVRRPFSQGFRKIKSSMCCAQTSTMPSIIYHGAAPASTQTRIVAFTACRRHDVDDVKKTGAEVVNRGSRVRRVLAARGGFTARVHRSSGVPETKPGVGSWSTSLAGASALAAPRRATPSDLIGRRARAAAGILRWSTGLIAPRLPRWRRAGPRGMLTSLFLANHLARNVLLYFLSRRPN